MLKTCYAITKSYWGLGNRIKCIIAACDICNNEHVTVIWPIIDNIKFSLKNIFSFSNSNELENENDVEDNIWISSYFLPVNDEIPFGFSDLKWKAIHGAAGLADSTEGKSIDFQYNKIPKSVINFYKKYWDRITPVDTVIKRTEGIIADSVLHVRTNSDFWLHLTLNLNSYLDIIQRNEGELYVVAHNPEIAKEIQTVFPNKIKLLPDKDYNSFIDIAAEMLIISKAKNIFVTANSTFPEVSWWMGGCKSNVTVLEVENA